MIHLTRLLLDWPKFLPFLRPPPLVARVIQNAAVADTQSATATTNRLRSELAYLAYTDAFGRRWDLAGSIRRAGETVTPYIEVTARRKAEGPEGWSKHSRKGVVEAS
jgi:hypothetical protein